MYDEVAGWSHVDGSKTEYEFIKPNCWTAGQTLEKLYDNGTGYIDANSYDGKLKPEYDAARKILGGDWRMPTYAEMKALVDNCDQSSTTQNGVKGCIFTGRGDYASKSIFLPEVGMGAGDSLERGVGGGYWSSSPFPEDSDSAFLIFCQSVRFECGTTDRFFGFPVRPVHDAK